MSAATATRSQLALQSYLDALLQEATFEDLEPPSRRRQRLRPRR